MDVSNKNKNIPIMVLVMVLLFGTYFSGRYYAKKTATVKAASEFGFSTQGTNTYPNGGLRLSRIVNSVKPSNGGNYGQSVIDEVNNKLYLGTCSGAGSEVLVKIDLQTEALEGTLVLDATDNCTGAIAVDPASNELYIGFSMGSGVDGRLVKVNTATFTRTAALNLSAGEEGVRGIAIDTTNGFIYLNTADSPSKIVKINKTTFTRVGAITLNAGEQQMQYVAPDFANNKIYYASYTTPTKVVRIDTNSFTRDLGVTLSTGGGAWGLSIDSSAGKLYVATYDDAPAKLFKLNTGTLVEESVITLDSSQNYAIDLVMDQERKRLFVLAESGNYGISVIDATSMTKLGVIDAVDDGNTQFVSGISYSQSKDKLYLFDDQAGDLRIFDTSRKGYIFGTKAVLSETTGITEAVKMYTHQSGGNLRMAVYDPDRRLVWQGPVVSNSGGVVSSSIASGGQSNLVLPTGTYYLAFQTDSILDIPSFTAGGSGDGFYLKQSFGEFPSHITTQTNTTEKYTMFVTYAQSQTVTNGGGGTLPVGGGSFYNPSTSGGGGGSSPAPTPESQIAPTPSTLPTVTAPEPVTSPFMGLKYSEIVSGVSYTSKVVKTKDNPTVYFITAKGYKLPYPTWESYISYGKTKEEILILNQDEINSFPDIKYITVNNNTYSITPQGKVALITPEQLAVITFNRDEVIEINSTQFASYY